MGQSNVIMNTLMVYYSCEIAQIKGCGVHNINRLIISRSRRWLTNLLYLAARGAASDQELAGSKKRADCCHSYMYMYMELDTVCTLGIGQLPCSH